LARDTISFEVTSIFNGGSQHGLVIGSVEHDTWKNKDKKSVRWRTHLERCICSVQ
jgi:hypothetical protein